MWKGPSIIVKHVMGFKIGSYQLENEITPWTLLLDPPPQKKIPLPWSLMRFYPWVCLLASSLILIYSICTTHHTPIQEKNGNDNKVHN